MKCELVHGIEDVAKARSVIESMCVSVCASVLVCAHVR